MTKIENIKLLIEMFNENYPELRKKTTLNQAQASRFIGCGENTIKNYRDEGIGPRYTQVGKESSRVFYTKLAIAEWLIDKEIKTA